MRAAAATGNRIGARPPLWSKCDGQELAKDFAPGLVMFSAAVSRHSRGWGGNAGWEGKLPESASSELGYHAKRCLPRCVMGVR